MREDSPVRDSAFEDSWINEMASLLHDFGGDLWDIAWQADGRLGARTRYGQVRPAGPFILFAETPAEMRRLLSGNRTWRWSRPVPCATGRLSLTQLAVAIGPMLHAAGLKVMLLSRAGTVGEIVVTNPRKPAEGKVIIDEGGTIDWDLRNQPADDAVMRHIATVLITILTRD